MSFLSQSHDSSSVTNSVCLSLCVSLWKFHNKTKTSIILSDTYNSHQTHLFIKLKVTSTHKFLSVTSGDIFIQNISSVIPYKFIFYH